MCSQTLLEMTNKTFLSWQLRAQSTHIFPHSVQLRLTHETSCLIPRAQVYLSVPALHPPSPATGSHSCCCGPQAIKKLQLCIQGRKFPLMELPTQEAQQADIFLVFLAMASHQTAHTVACLTAKMYITGLRPWEGLSWDLKILII